MSLIVSYRMKLSDWAAFQFYCLSRSPLIRLTWAALVFFTANGPLHARPAAASGAHVVGVWLSAAIAVTLIFVPVMVIVITISLVSRRRRNSLSEHTLEITESGIVEQTAHTRVESHWPGVRKIGEARRYLFLYLLSASAHVILKRALSDDAAWQKLVASCRRWQLSGRGGVERTE
jgi:hypothetical protein